MSSKGPFQIRWRGRNTGPHSLEEILRKLDEHEIGLWHEIGSDDHWIPLGEFLENLKRETARELQSQRHPQFGSAQHPPGATETQEWQRPTHAANPTTARLPPSPAALSEGARGATQPAKANPGRSQKLFVALGLILGFTGAHNFYAGYWGTALVQVVLSGLTLFLGFGIIVPWLWALIELVVVHSDARGRLMD